MSFSDYYLIPAGWFMVMGVLVYTGAEGQGKTNCFFNYFVLLINPILKTCLRKV
jgi:hypothetical protein